jgi:hypothetical protein
MGKRICPRSRYAVSREKYQACLYRCPPNTAVTSPRLPPAARHPVRPTAEVDCPYRDSLRLRYRLLPQPRSPCLRAFSWLCREQGRNSGGFDLASRTGEGHIPHVCGPRPDFSLSGESGVRFARAKTPAEPTDVLLYGERPHLPWPIERQVDAGEKGFRG